MRRVVVTGLGIVAPTGGNKDAAWRNTLEGRSGIRQITLFDTSQLPVHIAGEVTDFDASDLLGPKTARQASRFVQFACVAAHEALRDANYAADLLGDHCGCLIGNAIGGTGEIAASACLLKERGVSKISPLTLPYVLPNMASGFVAIQNQLRGPNFAIASACASGTHAIGEAARLIRDGETSMMLAGGSEAVICPLLVASFDRMRSLSRRNDDPQRASRPFDSQRDGFVVGEGCGLLVLEEYEHARQRGAEIYVEIAGYGVSADAFHISAPSPKGEGLARAMRGALTSSGINPEDVDYINAHGTSTVMNDALESDAILSVFGDAAHDVAISSTKGCNGHCLGAAGGIEAAFTVLAMRDALVPPTINLETPDPACPLDYTPNCAGKENSLRAEQLVRFWRTKLLRGF